MIREGRKKEKNKKKKRVENNNNKSEIKKNIKAFFFRQTMCG